MSWIVEPHVVNKTLPKAQLPRELSVFLKVSMLKKLISRSVNHLQGQAVIGVILGVLVICPFDEKSRFQNKQLTFGPKYQNFEVKIGA